MSNLIHPSPTHLPVLYMSNLGVTSDYFYFIFSPPCSQSNLRHHTQIKSERLRPFHWLNNFWTLIKLQQRPGGRIKDLLHNLVWWSGPGSHTHHQPASLVTGGETRWSFNLIVQKKFHWLHRFYQKVFFSRSTTEKGKLEKEVFCFV